MAEPVQTNAPQESVSTGAPTALQDSTGFERLFLKPWPGMATLIALGILPTLAALSNKLLLGYDDDVVTIRNPLVVHGLGHFFKQLLAPFGPHDAAAFEGGHWAPLPFLTLALEHSIFGQTWTPGMAEGSQFNAVAFRIMAGVFHGLCGWLVLQVGWKLTRNISAAVLAALLFLFHPVTGESIFWVVERHNIMAAMFGLLALQVYLGKDCREEPTAARTAGTFGLLLLSQLCKASGVIWWPVLVAADLLLLPGSLPRKLLRGSVLTLPIILSAYVMLSQSAPGHLMPPLGEPPLGPWLMTYYLLMRYVALLALPFNYSAFYFVPPDGQVWGEFYVYGMTLLVAAIVAAALKLGISWRRVLFYAIWIAAGVAPYINPLVNTSFVVQDRYAYPALMAFALLIAEIGINALVRVKISRPLLAAAPLAALLLILTFSRATAWRSTITLFADAAQKQPQSAFGHAYLASQFFHSAGSAEPAAAAQMLQFSLREHELALPCKDYDRMVYPYFLLIEHAELRHRNGDIVGTRELLRKVLDGRPERPTEYQTKLMAANFFAHDCMQQKKYAEALEYIERGLKMSPDWDNLLLLRIKAWLATGAKDQARAEAERLKDRPALAPKIKEIMAAAPGQ